MATPVAEDSSKHASYIALALLVWLIVSVVTAVWAIFARRICSSVLSCLAVVAALFLVGRLSKSTWDDIKNWAQLFSFSGIILAAYGAYRTYLTPFSPDVAAATIEFRL